MDKKVAKEKSVEISKKISGYLLALDRVYLQPYHCRVVSMIYVAACNCLLLQFSVVIFFNCVEGEMRLHKERSLQHTPSKKEINE